MCCVRGGVFRVGVWCVRGGRGVLRVGVCCVRGGVFRVGVWCVRGGVFRVGGGVLG